MKKFKTINNGLGILEFTFIGDDDIERQYICCVEDKRYSNHYFLDINNEKLVEEFAPKGFSFGFRGSYPHDEIASKVQHSLKEDEYLEFAKNALKSIKKSKNDYFISCYTNAVINGFNSLNAKAKRNDFDKIKEIYYYCFLEKCFSSDNYFLRYLTDDEQMQAIKIGFSNPKAINVNEYNNYNDIKIVRDTLCKIVSSDKENNYENTKHILNSQFDLFSNFDDYDYYYFYDAKGKFFGIHYLYVLSKKYNYFDFLVDRLFQNEKDYIALFNTVHYYYSNSYAYYGKEYRGIRLSDDNPMELYLYLNNSGMKDEAHKIALATVLYTDVPLYYSYFRPLIKDEEIVEKIKKNVDGFKSSFVGYKEDKLMTANNIKFKDRWHMPLEFLYGIEYFDNYQKFSSDNDFKEAKKEMRDAIKRNIEYDELDFLYPIRGLIEFKDKTVLKYLDDEDFELMPEYQFLKLKAYKSLKKNDDDYIRYEVK